MNARTTSTAPRAQLQVGIIGGGFMAEVHARAIRASGAALRGVASSTHPSAQRAATRLGVERAYPSALDLIRDPSIDVIHVCTPNSTHVALAMACLEAGRHVVCEKPLATTGADAEALTAKAETSGLIGAVPFVYRFHPMVREARHRVAAEGGTISTVLGSYLQDWLLFDTDDNWRVAESSGGPSRAFADIGSHLCDLLEFVTDDRIDRVCASSRIVLDSREDHPQVTTEDVVALTVQLHGGAIGSLLVSQVAPGRKNRLALEVHGSRETIGFDLENPEALWIGRRSGSRQLLRNPEELSADARRLSRLPAGHPQGYQDAFNAFVADTYSAISGTAPTGLPTFSDGLRAARLTDAVIRSAKTDEWVSVNEGRAPATP